MTFKFIRESDKLKSISWPLDTNKKCGMIHTLKKPKIYQKRQNEPEEKKIINIVISKGKVIYFAIIQAIVIHIY